MFFNKILFLFVSFSPFPDDQFFSSQPSQLNSHLKDRPPQFAFHLYADSHTQARQDSDEKIMLVVSAFTVGWEGWANRALDEPYKAYKHTLSVRSLYTSDLA